MVVDKVIPSQERKSLLYLLVLFVRETHRSSEIVQTMYVTTLAYAVEWFRVVPTPRLLLARDKRVIYYRFITRHQGVTKFLLLPASRWHSSCDSTVVRIA
jgi:hypothetical protein